MNDAITEPNDRRAKCLAYGLLVVAAITFTFEMGRQRGVVEGKREVFEQEDARAVVTMQMFDEMNRRLAANDAPANPL